MTTLCINAADGGCGPFTRLIGRLVALSVVGLLVVGCVSQRPLEGPESKLYFQKTEKYEKSSDGGSQIARQKKDGALDLSKKAIVLMRGKFVASNDLEYKAISIYYTTQPLETPYSGRVLMGESGWDTAKKIEYSSETNSFYAVAVEPGTYRYVWNAVGNPHWIISRFSPTRRIEFTVAAGEAVYVGDLSIVLPMGYIHRKDTWVGEVVGIRPGLKDYYFKVEQDGQAARQFYDGLAIENKPPLQVRIMMNEPMPRVESYVSSKCDGLWYIAYSSRGICK